MQFIEYVCRRSLDITGDIQRFYDRIFVFCTGKVGCEFCRVSAARAVTYEPYTVAVDIVEVVNVVENVLQEITHAAARYRIGILRFVAVFVQNVAFGRVVVFVTAVGRVALTAGVNYEHHRAPP